MKIALNKEINGSQLIEELKKENIEVMSNLSIEDGFVAIDVANKDESKTAIVFKNHVAIDQSMAKAAERQAVLDKLGLTAEEMAALLP